MPRRREVPKRVILPDPKHGSELLAKFTNMLMRDGKKSIAEKIIYGALDTIESRSRREPVEVLETALETAKSGMEESGERAALRHD